MSRLMSATPIQPTNGCVRRIAVHSFRFRTADGKDSRRKLRSKSRQVDDPLDSSTSYYEYFILTFDGTNLVEGTASTYLKTDLPGGGLATVGFRTKSAQAAAGLLGPGIQSMRAEEMGLESSAISNVAV